MSTTVESASSTTLHALPRQSTIARRLAALPRAEYDRLVADRKLLVRWIAENEHA